MLLSRKVDGLLVVGEFDQDRGLPCTQTFPVPVVYVYTPSEDPADLSFNPDNQQAAPLAIERPRYDGAWGSRLV